MRHPHLIALALVLAVSACTATQPYIAPFDEGADAPPTAEPAYRVFLIGDAGEFKPDAPAPALRLLQTQLAAVGENAAVVFLGDNLYGGLADSGSVHRHAQEARLNALLATVEGFPGRIVFLPGENDWHEGRPEGLDAVKRQETYIEKHLDRGNVFLPDDGFPGPVEVELTDYVTLLVLDTQWWLHRHAKAFGDTGEYEVEEDADLLLELDQLIKDNDDNALLVVGHHPVFSNGAHGGRLPLQDHLFPLTNVVPGLYVPLPLVGSAYPLYLRYWGGPQDLASPRYKALRRALLGTFAQHPNLVYAAGHDRNLQHFRYSELFSGGQHYIVSGAGAGSEPALRGYGASFVYSGGPGYAVLEYFEDGSSWLAMWTPEDTGETGQLLYRTRLSGPSRDRVDPGVPETIPDLDVRDSTVMMAANPDYAAGPIKRLFLGSHNRRAWTTPVEVPVLDLSTAEGGLTPVKRGGGQQTASLRLVNPKGREFVLRTLDKDPSGTVPASLQGTIATDIVQDQITSIHPFGAFAVPKLAEAVGVYHTTPRLVWVPDDPRLGRYRAFFANKLMMLEDRPDDDMSDRPNYGHSEKVISAHKLYEEINGDNDHRVDQPFFLRSRLFDMLLADWDRHRDQWRWASFEPDELDPTLAGEARKDGKIYRPIPRDRDWAFNRLTGLPSLARYFEPKFQDFDEGFGFLRGLTLNGLEQDRRFLAALTREDFIAIAEDIRRRLTNAVIEDAIRTWPDPIYEQDGERIIETLKIRRDRLPEIAESFYEMHARVVDVVGSNKHERFEVTRHNEDETEVVVYKTNKEREVQKELYRRTFFRDETREVRLYGLDGKDNFLVQGQARDGITIIAVGGAGEDMFVDASRIAGPGKKTRFYDAGTGTSWNIGRETRMRRSDVDPRVNEYDPFSYQHNASFPLPYFGSNKDDGVFVGLGYTFVRQGFRKEPYAASHTLKGNVATKTRAFNLAYEGHYVDRFGPADVTLEAAYLSPDNIRNFYGLGNETENEEDDRTFYQARLTQATLAPALLFNIDAQSSFSIGPSLQFTKVREDTERFLAIQPGISSDTFEDQWFGAVESALVLSAVDVPANPKQGFRWANEAALNIGLRNTSDTFARLGTDLAAFFSPSLTPQVTLALRTGATHNIGDFPFYAANTLGGTSNLRGYRSTRFAGRTAFYQNVDLRLELFTFSTYVAIGRFGLLGFLDNGRVWTDGEDSSMWHQGYGGGAWAEMFGRFVLSGTAGFSDDDQTFTLKLGFQY